MVRGPSKSSFKNHNLNHQNQSHHAIGCYITLYCSSVHTLYFIVILAINRLGCFKNKQKQNNILRLYVNLQKTTMSIIKVWLVLIYNNLTYFSAVLQFNHLVCCQNK